MINKILEILREHDGDVVDKFISGALGDNGMSQAAESIVEKQNETAQKIADVLFGGFNEN